MNRLLVFALVAVASIAHASIVFAEESLLESGARHVQQIATAESASFTAAASTSPAGAAVSIGNNAASSLQAEQPSLEKSGMRKRTKIMIALAIGAGFAASAWKIDHSVLDVTPSSLGTRKD
jgi:hypothetical protein